MHDSVRRLAVLALAAAPMIASAPAAGSTPPLMWQGVRSLGVQCIVQRGPYHNDAQLQSALCERVASLAARGAPYPVKVVPLGDPALIAPGRVALLVHASVEQMRGGRVMAFSIRPISGASGTEVLFAAAPRAVPLAGNGLASPAVDAAIGAALAGTLPWQARRQGAREIPARL